MASDECVVWVSERSGVLDSAKGQQMTEPAMYDIRGIILFAAKYVVIIEVK